MEPVNVAASGPLSKNIRSMNKSNGASNGSPTRSQHGPEDGGENEDGEHGRSTPPSPSQTVGKPDKPDDDEMHVKSDNGHEQSNEADDVSSNDLMLPEVEMKTFDWENLEDRYHNAMDQCRTNEDKLFQDFNSLSQYFGIWAETLASHEEERSYKRLKTQSTYVQKQEQDLEKRRLHYKQVVGAFEQALQLLNR